MIATLIGITLLQLAAWWATALMKRRSAALRHAIWTCAIGGALLLAPLRGIAPRAVVQQTLPLVFTPAVTVTENNSSHVLTSVELIAAIWILGAALAALRLVGGFIQLRGVIRGADFVRSAGPIPIRVSGLVAGPLVTGILAPAIVLPTESALWLPSRRRAVLAHELAHVRRRDPLILLLAHLATVVYWFHPLCWLAVSRLRAESERACDDAALRLGLLPSGYAGHLLDLARAFHPQPAIPMAATSHLESRVKSILDPLVNRSVAARRSWLAAAAATVLLLAPLTVFSLRAQPASGTGTIFGTVSDPTGARVARARLIASNTDEPHNREVVASRSDGAFTFRNIPAGRYSLEVSVGGFARARTDNLALANGETLEANTNLALGSLEERLQVVEKGAPAPLPAGPGRPIRIGGNVQAAKLLQQPKPVYPADMKAQRIEGTVFLSAIISKEGVPVSLTLQNTAVNPSLVTAAMDAVNQWRYEPTLLNGEAVDVLTTIEINFTLER